MFTDEATKEPSLEFLDEYFNNISRPLLYRPSDVMYHFPDSNESGKWHNKVQYEITRTLARPSSDASRPRVRLFAL